MLFGVCACASSSTEVDDMIRKSTNLLLTRTLSHCLQYAIKKKNVGLAEVLCVLGKIKALMLVIIHLEGKQLIYFAQFKCSLVAQNFQT